MELHMINIIYAALPMRGQTNAKTIRAKLYIYIGVGARDEAHMAALDIFRFAAFLDQDI